MRDIKLDLKLKSDLDKDKDPAPVPRIHPFEADLSEGSKRLQETMQKKEAEKK
jgi:hypothetical protein